KGEVDRDALGPGRKVLQSALGRWEVVGRARRDWFHSVDVQNCRTKSSRRLESVRRPQWILGAGRNYDGRASASEVSQPRNGDVRMGWSGVAVRDEPDARWAGEFAARRGAVICFEARLFQRSATVCALSADGRQAVHRRVFRREFGKVVDRRQEG